MLRATLACSTVLCLSAVSSAQDAPEARGLERPRYALQRDREDWSVLRDVDRTTSGDVWDPIKFVPLSDDGEVWASFGGHARARLESFDSFNFGFPAGAQHSDTYLLTRMALHGDLHVGDNLRVFAEFRTVNSTGRDLPGGNRTVDVDTADLQQAFADFRVPILDGETVLTLRLGRQLFLRGSQRLLSPRNWGNSLRIWDGVSVHVESDGWDLLGFVTQFVPVKKHDFNDVDRGEDFYGAHFASTLPFTEHAWELYFYGRERDSVTFNGTSGREDRYTLGSRVHGDLSDRFDFDVEAAWQGGTIGGQDIEAAMVAGDLGLSLPDLLGGSRAWIGFDYASGDRSNGGDVQTFDQMYPLGHAYIGLLDVFGRQNVIDARLGLDSTPWDNVSTGVAVHAFWLADVSDAIYNIGAGVSRPGDSGNDRFVGTEIDLTVTYRPNRHTATLFGYSHFFAGAMLEDTGFDDDQGFAYAQLEYTF